MDQRPNLCSVVLAFDDGEVCVDAEPKADSYVELPAIYDIVPTDIRACGLSVMDCGYEALKALSGGLSHDDGE